jgi:glutaredoxin 3
LLRFETVVELHTPTSESEFMSRVTVYSTASCGFCHMAKTKLDQWGIPFEEVRIDSDPEAMAKFAEVTNGARTVPQILIDGKTIGGFSELTELHMDGALDDLMEED